ncbi:unnamed protein product [Haemonchus placei]|uniref:SCP domain-containing protein n=1 Tax=Haemonchus placei TaxID=6290 RepID=A0A0N4WLA2_HAEPC|nr:unnamed protein product [Haemonchus placei]
MQAYLRDAVHCGDHGKVSRCFCANALCINGMFAFLYTFLGKSSSINKQVLESSVVPVHVATKALQDEFNCKINGTTMTPEKRKLSVYLANAYRTIATTGVFGYPPSQNMYQLNYSCLAEEYAMMLCNQQAPLNPVG